MQIPATELCVQLREEKIYFMKPNVSVTPFNPKQASQFKPLLLASIKTHSS